ncbi:MAG: NAD(P)H-quinone oxidoreductase [Alphaproteobacteria bacterium]
MSQQMANLPSTMTAIEISKPGGPEVLVPVERPLPQPAHGELLIKVAHAGVNRPDCMQREGGYPPPPGAPDIPGLEIAGEVIATGDGVSTYQVGDQVCALVPGGGYAEYCIAAEANSLPVPNGMTTEQASALPETFFTVWTNLFQRAGLKGGERVLIHGGASGIGTTAIQLAKAFGARIFVTAGSAEKCKRCEEMGAERAINYKDEDFTKVVAELTDGEGCDVIMDMVGGEYVMRNVASLAVEGRLVQIALQHGPKVDGFNFLPIMMKRLTLTGSTLRPRTVAQKAVIAEELKAKVWPLLESGAVAPVIDSVYPLNDAAGAHTRIDSGGHFGKILLSV